MEDKYMAMGCVDESPCSHLEYLISDDAHDVWEGNQTDTCVLQCNVSVKLQE